MSNTPKTDAFLQEYYDNDMYFGEESTQDMAEYARGLERQLEEAREELLNYKVKYNNQCAEMNRLKQSRKDQLAMIRKLKG